MEYRNQIKEIILDIIEMEEHEIANDEPFSNFDHIDSLNALDILTDLEKTFKIHIPEEELRHFETINSIIALVEKLVPSLRAA